MIKEIEKAYYELDAIWQYGNRKSLPFCRDMRQAINKIKYDIVYNLDGGIPQELEDMIDWLEEDIYNHWKVAKIEAGETRGILQIPVGD